MSVISNEFQKLGTSRKKWHEHPANTQGGFVQSEQYTTISYLSVQQSKLSPSMIVLPVAQKGMK